MPKAGEAYTYRISLFDSDGAIVANPTLAAGDVTVVDADGDAANVGTLPSVTTGDNRVLEGALTAAEMAGDAGDVVTVVFEDQSGSEWKPAVLVIPLTDQDIDDVSTLQQSDILDDATPFSGADIAAILANTGTDIPALIAALNDLSAAEVNAEVDTALADYDPPTHAELQAESTAIQSDLEAIMSDDAADPGVGDYDPATDSLEALRNRGDSAWITGGAGSGAIEFTYTLTEPPEGTGTPIADAEVVVFTDEAMTNAVATARTDAFGEVVFFLDPGTYYLRRRKSGYNFDNPDEEEVA